LSDTSQGRLSCSLRPSLGCHVLGSPFSTRATTANRAVGDRHHLNVGMFLAMFFGHAYILAVVSESVKGCRSTAASSGSALRCERGGETLRFRPTGRASWHPPWTTLCLARRLRHLLPSRLLQSTTSNPGAPTRLLLPQLYL